MKKIGLIFDLDGVIVDTAIYHYKAWKTIADELGFDFSLLQNEQLKGVSRMESLDRLLGFGGIKNLTDEEKLKLAERKNKLYVSFISKLTPEAVLPGVDQFMNSLAFENVGVALGSASKNAMTILKQIEYIDVFNAVIDGTKVKRSKPDPEVFLKAAAELDIDAENCIVFEDAEAGIKAAKLAGMKAIGVGDEQILKEANLIIPGFENFDFETCKRQFNL
ncbi:MAG: beta-phosphoglucomutase [Bacteroidetes bacterium]|nr:beta-phosphoglucomutase [Bacteroidota bacterium]